MSWMDKEMNTSKQKKINDLVYEKTSFEFKGKKKTLKLFEFLEQFMTNNFLIKST